MPDKADNKKIYIYNTLTREKETFIPVNPGEVRMYACGPTVYNYIHIGNARPLIFFDIVRRYFEYLEYNVTFVQNITDIDDKIIVRSIEEGISADEVASKYTRAFLEDCNSLGIKPPDKAPRATEYIEKMVVLIKKLVENGFAYEVEGNVFFEVSKYGGYGRLSRKDLTQMEIGERVEDSIRRQKRDPVKDFALWKTAKSGEPSWDSPWGKGRPGWHTECVVMSADLLGREFDIHAGGVDLVFPHHENEIAQAQCAFSDATFAKIWMHNEFLNLKGEKMAKSKGNVVLVKDLMEKKYRKEAIRFFFLQTHYRKPVSFSYEILDACQSYIEKLKYFYSKIENTLRRIQEENIFSELPPEPQKISERKKRIQDAMNKDFNTAFAVSQYFTLLSTTKQYVSQAGECNIEYYANVFYGKKLLDELDSVFGILPKDEDKRSGKMKEAMDELLKEEIEEKVKLRDKYRKKKDWKKADVIRDELQEMGIILEDTEDGTIWFEKQAKNI